jgi:hypothetical protein
MMGCKICSRDLYLHRFLIKLNLVVPLNSNHSFSWSYKDNFCRSLRKKSHSELQQDTKNPSEVRRVCQAWVRYLRSAAPVVMDWIPFQFTHFGIKSLHIVYSSINGWGSGEQDRFRKGGLVHGPGKYRIRIFLLFFMMSSRDMSKVLDILFFF